MLPCYDESFGKFHRCLCDLTRPGCCASAVLKPSLCLVAESLQRSSDKYKWMTQAKPSPHVCTTNRSREEGCQNHARCCQRSNKHGMVALRGLLDTSWYIRFFEKKVCEELLHWCCRLTSSALLKHDHLARVDMTKCKNVSSAF